MHSLSLSKRAVATCFRNLSELCQLQAANMLIENRLPEPLAHLNRGLPLRTDMGALHIYVRPVMECGQRVMTSTSLGVCLMQL